jgi:endoglucanase
LGAAALVPTLAQAQSPVSYAYGVYDPPGNFEDATNVSIEHIFLPWLDIDLTSLQTADAYAQQHARSLLITVEPWTWTQGQNETPAQLQARIKSGEYDAIIAETCTAIAGLSSPTTVRFAHEMEDDRGRFIWANWKPSVYIESYRRFVDICSANAPDADFMWSPKGLDNLAQYYPGDEYVDTIGLSIFGYEPYDIATLGKPSTFDEALKSAYHAAAVFQKPIYVAELGYSGSQAYLDLWEKDTTTTRALYPLLAGVVYFNAREIVAWPLGFGLPDWRVTNNLVP